MGIAQPPDPEFRSPDIESQVYEGVLTSVREDVKNGTIGCNITAIEDTVRERGEYVGWWPYITDPAKTRDTIQLYNVANRDAVLIFRAYCQ